MVDKEPGYGEAAMNRALSPWRDNPGQALALEASDDYEYVLREGLPEVGVLLGAPADEMEIRYEGAESDILHLAEKHGGEISEMTFLIPEEEYETNPSRVDELVDDLDLGLEIGEGWRTRADDFKEVKELTEPGDSVHAYGSDYCHAKDRWTGRMILPGRDLTVFGFETDEIGKDTRLNRFLQTADISRQSLYALQSRLGDIF